MHLGLIKNWDYLKFYQTFQFWLQSNFEESYLIDVTSKTHSPVCHIKNSTDISLMSFIKKINLPVTP